MKEIKDEHTESKNTVRNEFVKKLILDMKLAKHHIGFLQTTVTRLDNINGDLKICDKIVDETTPSLLESKLKKK